MTAHPQRGDEAAGGVSHQGQRRLAGVLRPEGADDVNCLADFGVVVIEVGHVAAMGVCLQAPPVVMHV
ncbi:hypothetical protein D9M72_444730 [compost metagenome]